MMKTSNRNLLAIALATVLLSPAVLAQKGVGGDKGVPMPPRAVPTQDLPPRGMPEKTMSEIEKTTNDASAQVDATTPPPSPPQSQGAEHAAAHSSVVQRDLWTRLDADGDGRISTTEGATDAGFNARFAAYDADSDGFVTDAEYREGAKVELETGRGGTDAAARTGSSMGDPMRRLDANGDGSISLSEGEADATVKANFSVIDSNSDGLVTRAEYRAWLRDSRR